MTGAWALVTSAGQGLGFALTEHLLDRGWKVVAHFRSSGRGLDGLRDRVGSDRLLPVAADLSEAPGRERLAAAVQENTGRLGLLLNNLGVYPQVGLLDTDLALWERTFSTTCTAAFHLIQMLHPLMATDDASGRIINIGDAAIDRVTSHVLSTPYYIAKYGLLVLTRSYAQVLAPKGITVNMISPGFLENSIGEPAHPLPAGRKGTFADISGALDYLMSAEADYASGANLVVSGGYALGPRYAFETGDSDSKGESP